MAMVIDLDESPKRAFMKHIGPETATIRFGDHIRTVHTDLLRLSSIFATIINTAYKNGTEAIIEVQGRPDIIFFVLDWFYSKELPSDVQLEQLDMVRFRGDFPANLNVTEASLWQTEGLVLSDMYIFADRYDIPLLRQALMHAFIDGYVRGRVQSCVVWLITKSLKRTSQLFALTVDVFALQNHDIFEPKLWYGEGWDCIDASFWRATTQTFMNKTTMTSRLPKSILDKYRES